MATLKYSRQRESIKEFLRTRTDHRRCDKKERQGKFLYGFLCCSSGGICGGKSKQEKGISGDPSVLL